MTKEEAAEGKVSEDQAIVYAQTVELRCLTQEVLHVLRPSALNAEQI